MGESIDKWFREVLPERLLIETGPIIYIRSRVHEDDIPGHIEIEPGEYEYIRFRSSKDRAQDSES